MLFNIIQWGETPLHWAAYNNSKECLELLLSYGAEVNMKKIVSIDIIVTNSKTVHDIIITLHTAVR